MLRNNEQNLRQAMLLVRNIVEGERENFKHTFKHILSLIVVYLRLKQKLFVSCIPSNLTVFHQ